jgi:hypothetical protein
MDQSKREAFAFACDGAVLVRGFLDAGQMAMCRAAFDWNIANPGSSAVAVYPGSERERHRDNANPRVAERLTAVGVTQLARPEFLVEIRAMAVKGSALA